MRLHLQKLLESWKKLPQLPNYRELETNGDLNNQNKEPNCSALQLKESKRRMNDVMDGNEYYNHIARSGIYIKVASSLVKRNLRLGNKSNDNDQNNFCNNINDDTANKNTSVTTINGNHNDSNNNNRSNNDDIKLLSFKEAPVHLAFNRNIQNGYRNTLTSQQCIASIFWLTNETINIWSHLFGCFLFLGMLLYDLFLLNFHASLTDKLIVGGLLLCFQGCMVTSVIYHTFNCRSEKYFHKLLKYDLYGITFSLLAIYMSGIYYAFWCNVDWCIFYSLTVGTIFIAVMVIQMVSPEEKIRIGIFVFWAIYGIIPTIHWTITMGGWNNPIVQKLLPRVINMYLISGLAFFFYISYIPERFFPGRFDFIGSSHQAWHCLVVYALYYWHNTGIHYIEYRMNHSCLPLE